MAGWWSAVGWNWTNSTSAVGLPLGGPSDAVARRLGRVGRDRVELAGTPGGEDDVVGPDGDGAAPSRVGGR